MLLLIVAVGLLALSGFLVSEVVSMPERQRRTLVRRAAHYGAARNKPTDRERASLHDRMLVPVSGRIARLMLRLNPRESLDTVQQRLLAAGMHDVSPSGFLAAKAILAGGGLVRRDAADDDLERADRAPAHAGVHGGRLDRAGLDRRAPGDAPAGGRSAGSSPTRSTCSRSASRPASASTARSRS